MRVVLMLASVLQVRNDHLLKGPGRINAHLLFLPRFRALLLL